MSPKRWLLTCWLLGMVPGVIQGQVNPQQIPDLEAEAFTDYLKALPERDFDPEVLLSPEQAQADLYILKRVLEEAHTPIYRYADKAKVDSCFAAALEKAAQPMSYLDMVRQVARIQHTIACGHSAWSHPPAFFPWRNQHLKLFPFDLEYREGQWLILRNNSLQTKIKVGSEVLALDGVPIEEVMGKLKAYMYADGHSADDSWWDQERAFPNALSNFLGLGEQLVLKVRSPGKRKAKPYRVEALNRPLIDSLRKVRYPADPGMGIPLRFEVDEPASLGRYTIRWFNKNYHQQMGQDFEAFTDSVFQVVADKDLKHLVIDLRGNGGGWTAYGSYLFSYLVDEEVAYMEEVSTQNPGPYAFEPIVLFPPGYLDTFDLQLQENGEWRWANYPSLRTQPSAENRFQGQVFILTDNGSRSCSAVFSSLSREHTDAVFIGEETGGTRLGAGGMVMGIALPHSSLRVFFSTARYTTAISGEQQGRGVLPDYPVDPPPRGQEGRDPAMLKVRELIK